MALTIGDNFSYMGAKPLDGRLKYDTVASMKAMADSVLYDGCLAYCVATEKTYQWKSTNDVDVTLGKWREFESGGGGDTSSVELTQLEYDALTEEEKLNGTVYYITDAISTSQIAYVGSKFNRSDIYKETEEVIGSWIDGKPLYQKIVNFTVTSGGKTYAHNIQDVEHIHMVWGYLFTGNNETIPLTYSEIEGASVPVNMEYSVVVSSITNSNFYIYTGTRRSNKEVYMCLNYTKTTDTVDSAIYANENDYSTDETIIGKWIDGKPLYQKTLNGTVSDGGTLSIPSNIIIRQTNGFVQEGGNTALPLAFYQKCGYDNYLSFWVNYNNTTIVFQMAGRSSVDVTVTIQYTKTTD